MVNSLVKDLLTPVLDLLIGGIDFSDIFIALRRPHTATLAAKQAGAVTLNLGVVANACIQFLVIAFAVFWLMKVASRMYRAPAAEPAEPPPPPRSETLLAEIRDLLRERLPA